MNFRPRLKLEDRCTLHDESVKVINGMFQDWMMHEGKEGGSTRAVNSFSSLQRAKKR
jgi:hypothetical protein